MHILDFQFQIYYYSYRRILQLCFNIKLPLDKQYEKFIKKLMNKLPIINNKDILLQKNQIENNNKINMDINNIEDKIKNLREYFHQKIKLSELKSKNNMKKTNKNVGIFNKKREIELNLDNLLYELKTKEKDNYFYYVSKIKNILEKNKYIKEKEISNAKNKLEKNELVLLKNKSDISSLAKNSENEPSEIFSNKNSVGINIKKDVNIYNSKEIEYLIDAGLSQKMSNENVLIDNTSNKCINYKIYKSRSKKKKHHKSKLILPKTA